MATRKYAVFGAPLRTALKNLVRRWQISSTLRRCERKLSESTGCYASTSAKIAVYFCRN
jgi:hypothetical protein